MGEPRLTVDVRGLRQAGALFDALSGQELQNRTRRATRAGTKLQRKELREQARSRSDLPRSFSKTRTANHRNPLGSSVGPSSSLINIFEPGAQPHVIGQPGQMLHSQQGEKLFVARGPVNHPGMDARPLIGPVFDATHDDAAEAAMDELVRGLR